MTPRIVRPIRNGDGPRFFESFLVAAVVSFLGIRWSLTVTGFPRLGQGELHIGHMLWGGALMLAGLLLLLAYLDRSVQHVAAVVAGLGFGTFVDEIGKFVTADNDYFFRPAVALIYVVFVVVYLVARALAGEPRLTGREAVANALDLVQGTIGRSIETEDRARIERLLDQADTDPELVASLRRYLDAVPGRPDEEAWWETIPRRAGRAYERLAVDPRFDAVLTIAVVVYAVGAMVGSLLVVLTARPGDAGGPGSIAAVGQLASTLAGAALVGRGVIALPTSRVEAYRWFMRGVLVWLLVTQVFIFYDSQFAGLWGLAFDLLAYVSLRYVLRREAVEAGRRGASGA